MPFVCKSWRDKEKTPTNGKKMFEGNLAGNGGFEGGMWQVVGGRCCGSATRLSGYRCWFYFGLQRFTMLMMTLRCRLPLINCAVALHDFGFAMRFACQMSSNHFSLYLPLSLVPSLSPSRSAPSLSLCITIHNMGSENCQVICQL